MVLPFPFPHLSIFKHSMTFNVIILSSQLIGAQQLKIRIRKKMKKNRLEETQRSTQKSHACTS